MPREMIYTELAPKPPDSFSQAIRSNGMVYVSGQGPFHPVTGKIVGETIREQTAQCLKNISVILHAAGSNLEQVVSATFILVNECDFPGMNEEWVKWFPKDPPARQGAKLPISPPGMKISIALIAAVE